ncbi:hypothetical protein ACW2Q0_17015 [Nocardia sp. R16R-3T]
MEGLQDESSAWVRGDSGSLAQRRHREYADYAAQRLYAIDTAVDDDPV